MNTILKNITLLACFGAVLISCKKEDSQSASGTVGATIAEVTVPAGFDFSTEKDVILNLSLSQKNIEGVHRVDIYKKWDGNSASEMIYSEFVEAGEVVDQTIKIPAHLKELFVIVNAPYGNSYLETVPVTGVNATFDLGYTQEPIAKKAAQASPDCNSGCDATYNTSFNVNNGGGNPTTVCITGGSNLSVNLNKQNMVVKICGTVSFQNFGISKGTVVHITDGADVTFGTFSVSGDSEVIIYDADVHVNNNLIVSGKLTNDGEITVDGELNVNSKGELINNSNIDVVGHLNNNEKMTNNSRITVGGHLHFNGSSETYNYCYIYTADQLHVNNNFHNYGYIEALLKITFAANNSGANKVGTMLYNGSMVKGSNGAFLNGYVQGNGTTSLIQITAGESKINGGGELNGNVEFCDADGLEVNGTVSGAASVSCNVVIATTTCNPGTPTAPCTDSDNDGVCDDVDKFPNDPDIAGCNCYPDCDNFGTLTYEDLWPGVGDYDFNDLVVEYQYIYLTNANDDVVTMKPSFLITAIGASFRNGFGFQLETPPSSVASVSGQIMTESYIINESNGAEAGHPNKATIIAFDNSKTAFSAIGAQGLFQNTILTEPYQAPDTIFMSVEMAQPTAQASLGTAPHNPFLIVNMTRGREVHLKDHEPTNLADLSYFGANSDASEPGNGKYYQTKEGFCWAMNLPVSFDYPIEKNEISLGYLNFTSWVNSGGTLNTDWYLDLPGYRNAAHIY